MSKVITRPRTKKIFEIFLIDFELMAFRFEEIIFDFLPFDHAPFSNARRRWDFLCLPLYAWVKLRFVLAEQPHVTKGASGPLISVCYEICPSDVNALVDRYGRVNISRWEQFKARRNFLEDKHVYA